MDFRLLSRWAESKSRAEERMSTRPGAAYSHHSTHLRPKTEESSTKTENQSPAIITEVIKELEWPGKKSLCKIFFDKNFGNRPYEGGTWTGGAKGLGWARQVPSRPCSEPTPHGSIFPKKILHIDIFPGYSGFGLIELFSFGIWTLIKCQTWRPNPKTRLLFFRLRS